MPAVHFSHHVCGRWFHPTMEQLAEQQREHGDIGDGYAGCRIVRASSTARTTTDPAQVTCKLCRAALAGRGDAASCASVGSIGGTFPGHRKMIERAWLTCCRHRGAAWPFDACELAAVNRERLERGVSKGWALRKKFALDDTISAVLPRHNVNATYIVPDGDISKLTDALAGALREQANCFATALKSNGPLASAMHPALAELLLAAEWLEEVSACMLRGEAIVESVIERVRSGEIRYAA